MVFMKAQTQNGEGAANTCAELKEDSPAIRDMTPLQALQSWLDGKVGIEEEAALLEALHKDKQISLSDEEIIDCVFDAMESELGAKECLERLQLATRAAD